MPAHALSKTHPACVSLLPGFDCRIDSRKDLDHGLPVEGMRKTRSCSVLCVQGILIIANAEQKWQKRQKHANVQ